MSGCVIWLTGLPSSGKSTLARAVLARLREQGSPAVLLDGDEVREALLPSLGHAPAERDRFYAILARLSALLARQGLIAVVAATANRREHRSAARALAPRFVEVYLDVPADVCRQRDAKGLYALADRGAAPHLPGAGADYEPPIAPDVVARGGDDADAVAQILRLAREG